MTDPAGREFLAGAVSAVMRVGTLVAMAIVAIGYGLMLITDTAPGSPPIVELLLEGGAGSVIGLGLLGLTLLPVLVLAASAIGFRRLREHRLVVTTLVALLLLLASLALAVILTPAG